MFNIIRVGLPVTKTTVTDEFIEIVESLASNNRWIGIMTCDYDSINKVKDQLNAPAGYDVLQKYGFSYSKNRILNNKTIGTFGDLWGVNRDPIKVTTGLLKEINRYRFEYDTVILFTPGNPYIDDSITKVLLSLSPDMRVVTTKGAPEIAVDLIQEETKLPYKIRDYYDDFILGKDTSIDKSYVHIFSCLQDGYNISLVDALNNLNPSSIVLVNVAEEPTVLHYDITQALDLAENIYKNDITYTFGFIFDN